MIKFAYTILYVSEVEKSLSFYEATFGFLRRFITPEKDYGELNTGETSIAFASRELAQSNLKDGYQQSTPEQKPFGIELGIVTDEVEVLVAKATQNGAVLVVPPAQKPWGQTVAYIRDPDGFLIEICTPVH